jgi:hypothetical protein
MRTIRVNLEGTPEEVARLEESLRLVLTTRYGSAVLADVMSRDDVTIAFKDSIGFDLPNGKTLTTGGTAITVGRVVHISRAHYGRSSPAVLAAMQAHELTHVAQNIETGNTWWNWPWTTVEREVTAHLLQAVVWAELRGEERDWEQDINLERAQDRTYLRQWIMKNPAYPRWLAPDISC